MTPEETAERFVGFAVRLKRAFRSGIGSAGGTGSAGGIGSAATTLTEERFRTLHYLEESGGAGLKELSERIRISPSSLCIMLGKLEEESFVERSREEHDRRNVHYRLTETGAHALKSAREHRLAAFAARFAALDSAERDRFAAAIAEVETLIGVLDDR